MKRALDKVITKEVGAVHLRETFQECLDRYKKMGLEYTVEERPEYNGTLIAIGDYKNFAANVAFVYRGDELITLDLCDSMIEQLVFTDGTTCSYDEYRERNKDNIVATRYCDISGEEQEAKYVLPNCSHKKCDYCRHGYREEYELTDKEIGYKLCYDNVANDAGMKALCKLE